MHSNDLQALHQIGAVMRSGDSGAERTLWALFAPGPVNSPSRITLEYNGKIRPQPDRENSFSRASGGGDGSDVEPSLPPKSLIFHNMKIDALSPRPATAFFSLHVTGSEPKRPYLQEIRSSQAGDQEEGKSSSDIRFALSQG